MDGWMHGWLAGWLDGWMDGWMWNCLWGRVFEAHPQRYDRAKSPCPSSGRGPGHGLRDRCRGLGGDSGYCRLQLLSSSLWLSSWLLFRNTPDLPDAVAPMVVS